MTAPSPPRRASRGRADRLLITVLGGAVCGLLGGVLAATLWPESPAETSAGEPAAGVTSGDAAEGVGAAGTSSDRPRSRTARHRHGDSGELGRRLSSEDPEVRYTTVLELLRSGRAGLRRLEGVNPPTRAGQLLVARAHESLRDLVANESHASHARLPEVSRMELRLRAFARVVPEAWLREERLAYWNARLELEQRRVEGGGGTEGEVALARLERDRVLVELGRLELEEFRRLGVELHADASRWVESLGARRDVPPARVAELRESLARVERRLE